MIKLDFFNKIWSAYPFGLLAFFFIYMLFGGASNEGSFIHANLNIVAFLVLIFLLFYSKTAPMAIRDLKQNRQGGIKAPPVEICFACIFLLLAFFQTIPLPYDFWINLPQRDIVESIANVLQENISSSISFNPSRTLMVATPIAIALVVILTVKQEMRGVHKYVKLFFLPAFAIFSAILGISQLFNATLLPYEYFSPNAPIGVFSNTNHQATLMLMAFPFLAVGAWYENNKGHKSHDPKIPKLALLTIAIILFSVLIRANSLAGYLLFLPVFGTSLLIMFGNRRLVRINSVTIGVTLAIILLLVFMADTSQITYQSYQSYQSSVIPRSEVNMVMFQIISEHRIFGTGLGSFEEVYRMFEDGTKVTNIYYNHAHNDYLEWIMETGIIGGLLLVTFFTWLIYLIYKIWSAELSFNIALGRAASISLLVVAAHSCVDYPIRTYTIAIASAFCLGLIMSAAKRV